MAIIIFIVPIFFVNKKVKFDSLGITIGNKFIKYEDISYAAICRIYSFILRYYIIGIYDKKGKRIGKMIFDEITVNEVYERLLDEIAKRLCEVSTGAENLFQERF